MNKVLITIKLYTCKKMIQMTLIFFSVYVSLVIHVTQISIQGYGQERWNVVDQSLFEFSWVSTKETI